MEKKYDIVIMGAGVGGVIAALTASRFNQSVLLIEKERLGGASFNWGALPFQELIKVARTFQLLKKSEEMGIEGLDSKKLKLNWPKMKANAQLNARRFKEYMEKLLKQRKIDYVQGMAEALNPHQIEVNGEVIETKDLIIATGSTYEFPSFYSESKDRVSNFYTPKTFFSIASLPESVLIIGGGLVGIEYALLLASLDVKVTVIEQNAEFMPYLDKDLSASLMKDLKDRKIILLLKTCAIGFEVDEKGSRLVVQGDNGEFTLQADSYLSAIRRAPNLDGIRNLLQTGLELREGYIRSDQRLKTTLPHVYAVGDVNGRAMLAHVASKEGETAIEVINGSGGHIIYELLHYNMYAINQLASVGMTEETALESGFLVASSKLFLKRDSDQYVKVVYDKATEEVLGVHIYADNASDLICEAQYVMERSESVHEFSKLIHTHPIHSMEIVERMTRG